MEILIKMLLRKKYFRDSQIISLTKSLIKILDQNALEYLAFGDEFTMNRLTGSNFWSSEDRVCSVDNKFSVISVWLILSLGIVKTELSLCLRSSGISV